MSDYVLDTSALLAYIEDEEGATEVEALLQRAVDGEVSLFISVVSCIEVFYISWQEQGKEVAIERLKLMDDLMVIQEPVDNRLTPVIGEIKATNTLSLADCCIAGLAKVKQAILVHKDPEYEQVESEIQQLKRPYKRKRK